MPGLEVAVLEVARAAGIPLSLGTPVPWLSGRGHLNDVVQRTTPEPAMEALAAIHDALGGDAQALASKRRANPPTPDLMHTPSGTVVEVDEVQHFTSARLVTFEHYPPGALLGFDVDEYRDLITRWRVKGDRAYAHKVAADFPKPGGRQTQRAYNDALRDLLAPTFTGQPVVRLPVPDRNLDGIGERLRASVDRLSEAGQPSTAYCPRAGSAPPPTSPPPTSPPFTQPPPSGCKTDGVYTGANGACVANYEDGGGDVDCGNFPLR